MEELQRRIQAQLMEMQDMPYRTFQCKLMPTVDPETVIGVRTPLLRGFAKQLAKTPDAVAFLQILPHRYYEENNLHGFLIETIRDYDATIAALDAFLPYVDNWATCDLMSPRIFSKHLPELYEKIQEWIASEQTYTVRFGIEMLMRFYLDAHFFPEAPALVAGVSSEEYYVNMMIAWYFATALAKQYDATLPYLTERRLGKWTHNKTIQKAIESDRIDADTKRYLKTLKQK